MPKRGSKIAFVKKKKTRFFRKRENKNLFFRKKENGKVAAEVVGARSGGLLSWSRNSGSAQNPLKTPYEDFLDLYKVSWNKKGTFQKNIWHFCVCLASPQSDDFCRFFAVFEKSRFVTYVFVNIIRTTIPYLDLLGYWLG